MRFRRLELLAEAMTHASWNNEKGRTSGPGSDNERLEYLGDAVLELVVGEYLFRRFPNYDEGQLTQLRAALVNTLSLARLAEKLQLGEALMLGKGAAKTGAQRLPSLLANAFEAMIGAIFLDQGYRVATRVFLQNIGNLEDWGDTNHKGKLQEVAQQRSGQAPSYRVQNVGGPGHKRLYSAEALVADEVLGKGTGTTKQAAEQAAAQAALTAIGGRPARRPRDTAGRAVATARRAAGEAVGETPRSRRRMAEAAVERDAAAAAGAGTRRRRPGPAAAAAAATPAADVAAPPSAGRRRGGFLAALRTAAEVLVGRKTEEPPAPSAAPPVASVTLPTVPVEATPDATPARSRTRRGRRGGRGRRKPAGAADAAQGSPAAAPRGASGTTPRPRGGRPPTSPDAGDHPH